MDFRKCVFFDDRSGVLGDAVVAGKLAIASVAGLEGFDVCGVAAFAPSFNLDFRKRVFFDDRSGVLRGAAVEGKVALASVAGVEGFDVCGVEALARTLTWIFLYVVLSMIGVVSLGVLRLRA